MMVPITLGYYEHGGICRLLLESPAQSGIGLMSMAENESSKI